MERRDVMKGGALAVAATSTVGTFVLRRRGRDLAFTLEHADDLQIWIGSGETFRLEVRRGGEVIEAHDDLDRERLYALDSAHVRVRRAKAPQPA